MRLCRYEDCVCVCVTMLHTYDSQELVLHLMHLPVVILNQRRERKTGFRSMLRPANDDFFQFADGNIIANLFQ